MSFQDVLPDSAPLGKATVASSFTARRRARTQPQSGMNYGSAGAGGANQQIQFLIADNGGLIDLSSVVVHFSIQTAGTGTVPDDIHPFVVSQVQLNGQQLDSTTNAAKASNVWARMGGSQSWYKSAGSFMGAELLNGDLAAAVPPSSYAAGSSAFAGFGTVNLNVIDLAVRCSRAATAQTGLVAGEQRSVPLGLISSVGRCKTLLPLSLAGELTLILVTGSYNEVLYQNSNAADATYSLNNVYISYDIVVPSTDYMQVLQKVVSDGGSSGLNIPFESTIVASGGQIGSSATLVESTIIASRATNWLQTASLVLIPTAGIQNPFFPSQSCFSRGGVNSFQYRVGSNNYPMIAAAGDGDMFATSKLAWGSLMDSCVVNRALWGNSSNCATAGTAAVYETAQASSGGTVKFYGADSFCPSYGFKTIKDSDVEVSGLSLSGASGSQIQCVLQSAGGTAYTPFMILTALKFIKLYAGAVQVVGA